MFIEGGDEDQRELEQEADRFAADELIPPDSFQTFIERPDRRTQAAVVAFAQEIGVDPSIVGGRLHHEGHLPHSHLNNLRSRFAWTAAAHP